MSGCSEYLTAKQAWDVVREETGEDRPANVPEDYMLNKPKLQKDFKDENRHKASGYLAKDPNSTRGTEFQVHKDAAIEWARDNFTNPLYWCPKDKVALSSYQRRRQRDEATAKLKKASRRVQQLEDKVACVKGLLKKYRRKYIKLQRKQEARKKQRALREQSAEREAVVERVRS